MERPTMTIVAQINGKVRGSFEFSVDAPKEDIEAEILSSTKLSEYMNGKEVIKTIYIDKKLLSIVIR